MVEIDEVAERIYLIDDHLYSIPKFGSVYLLNEERKALIDCGPATSANYVLDGMKQVGVRPEDITYIIATHIHLDHAGGAGVLLRGMPQAQVIVHYKGVKHLVDPARLIDSVADVYGEEPTIRHGEVMPIESRQVLAIHDGDTIRLSKEQILKFIDTPGHAPHELCIYETRNGGLFVGDAVGLSVFENEILLPFHPLPNFDLELYLNTLERLTELAPNMLYYAHFGVSSKVDEDFRLARGKLQIWDDIIAKASKEGDFDDASRRLVAQASAELKPIREVESRKSLYEFLTQVYLPLCAAGHIKYYQEAHKAYYMEAK